MAKLDRVTAKPFGLSGTVGNFGQFGSLAAGGAVTSQDPEDIQALQAWELGLSAALLQIGNQPEVPAMQDINGVFLVAFYQLAYLLQSGMPEWDAGTTYYINSFAQVNGTLYRSLTNGNTGNNPVTDVVNWVAAPNAAIEGSLFGFQISNNVSDPTFRLDFARGSAKDSAGLYLIQAEAMTKNVTATWAAGSGQGGLDTGSIGSSAVMVYCYAIGDTNGIEPGDFLFSKSASSPTIPSGYNLKRMIGARRWNGTSFDAFVSVGSGLDRWTYYSNPKTLTTTLSSGAWTDLSCASFVPTSVCRQVVIGATLQQSSVAQVNVYARVKGSTASADGTTRIASDHDDQSGPGNPDATGSAMMALNSSGVFQYQTNNGSSLLISLRSYMESL